MPSPFLRWMDSHILHRFRGKFGYTVLFGAIVFFTLLLALGIDFEAQGLPPLHNLMLLVRFFAFPAIICWGAFVGNPHKPPGNLMGQVFFFFCGVVCFVVVEVACLAMVVLHYF